MVIVPGYASDTHMSITRGMCESIVSLSNGYWVVRYTQEIKCIMWTRNETTTRREIWWLVRIKSTMRSYIRGLRRSVPDSLPHFGAARIAGNTTILPTSTRSDLRATGIHGVMLPMSNDGTMRAREYEVLVRAVEDGARYRAHRYWKHREDSPPEYLDDLVGHIVQGVTDSIAEWFTFDDTPDEPAVD